MGSTLTGASKMTKQKMTFEFVTREATSIEQITNVKMRAAFHYWNPNGLIQEKRGLNDRIRDLVEAGTVRYGWHLAYGTFNDFWEKEMIRVAMKSRPSRREYNLAAQLLRENNEKIEAKVAEVEAWAPSQVLAAQTEILAARTLKRIHDAEEERKPIGTTDEISFS